MSSDKRIMIMAGGTGGHVFPALAVAKYLVKQGWQVQVLPKFKIDAFKLYLHVN